MKKFLFCLLLVSCMLIVVSCANEEPDPQENQTNELNESAHQNEHGDDGNATNEQHGENAEDEDSDVGNSNGNNSDSGSKDPIDFDMTQLSPDDLKQGVITGLPFAIGDSFETIQQQWGIPIEEDYLRGGQFHSYHVGNYAYHFFDPSLDEITGVQISPTFPITLDEIRETLGEADFDELDDMLYEARSLTYYFDDYTLFFIGKSDNQNSEIHYMFLKEGR